MQLVILAAGRGSRLGGDQANQPKSLVSVGSVPYLKRQLESFRRFSFSKKILVGGYGIAFLRDFLVENNFTDITLIDNTDFLKGNLYSLATARSELTEDFFVFNADHFYSPETYQSILTTRSDNITIFCDKDRSLTDDDMKVRLAKPSGHLAAMSKTLSAFEAGYVGVTYVPKLAYQRYWDAFDATAAKLGDKANVENVLDGLAAEGGEISVCDISGSWWTEIDTPEDLGKARQIILSRLS